MNGQNVNFRLLTFLVIVWAGLTAFVLAGDADKLLGTWKIVQFRDDGGDKIGRLGAGPAQGKRPERIAKLVVTKDEIYVVRADGQRDVAAGLTNCAWRSCRLHEEADPKHIDIVGVPGRDVKPKNYFGIYELKGDKLSICWNETPRTADPAKIRPTQFESDGEMNLFVCERMPAEAGSAPDAVEKSPSK